MVHVARHSLTNAPSGGPQPTIIGSAVTIGHAATLHACKIGDGCLVGGRAGRLQGRGALDPEAVCAGSQPFSPWLLNLKRYPEGSATGRRIQAHCTHVPLTCIFADTGKRFVCGWVSRPYNSSRYSLVCLGSRLC